MIKIHKEGHKIVAIISTVFFLTVLFVTVILINKPYILISLLTAFILLEVFILRFFRIPDRKITPQEGIIYSPADGKIVAIEEVFEDEFLKEKRIQISIFMSVWDVHINYFPFKGKVIYYKYHPGKFLVARHPKSSVLNERVSVGIETEKGQKVLVREIAGIVARRISCYALEGKTFNAGDELGFIKFGSRVDIFLPPDARIFVKMKEKVYGKKTALAAF